MSTLNNISGTGGSNPHWIVGRNQNSIKLVNATNEITKVRGKVLDAAEAAQTSPLEAKGLAFKVTIKDGSGTEQTIRVLSLRALGKPFSTKEEQKTYQDKLQKLGGGALNSTDADSFKETSSMKNSDNTVGLRLLQHQPLWILKRKTKLF